MLSQKEQIQLWLFSSLHVRDHAAVESLLWYTKRHFYRILVFVTLNLSNEDICWFQKISIIDRKPGKSLQSSLCSHVCVRNKWHFRDFQTFVIHFSRQGYIKSGKTSFYFILYNSGLKKKIICFFLWAAVSEYFLGENKPEVIDTFGNRTLIALALKVTWIQFSLLESYFISDPE